MIKVIRSSSGNSEVTNYYLDVIASIVDQTGENIYKENVLLNQCKKEDIIIAPTIIDFLKSYIKGYKTQIYWMQGLDPEESYMKNGSKFRKFILDIITKFTLKKAIAIFYVSDEMKKYVEKKYSIKTDKKSFVMPCFNVSIKNKFKFSKEKYKKNIFAYVGSLSPWQCFEETLNFYQQIKKFDSNSELRIITFEEEKAKKIIKEKKIDNCTVCSVPHEMIMKALSDVKFGFVLRKKNPINYVATPTKLSSYLSAGVIPIFSKSLKDFDEKTKKLEYVVPIVDFNLTEKLKTLLTSKIDEDKLNDEYIELFKTYYNPEYYINNYKEKMNRILEKYHGSK